jgi:hypothetical protein
VLFLDHPIHHHKLSVLAEVFTPSPDLRFDCKSKIDHVTGQSLIGRCVPPCATVVLLSDKHVAVCVLSALYGLIFRVRDACETDLKHYSPIAVYHIFSFPPAQCTIPVYTQLTAWQSARPHYLRQHAQALSLLTYLKGKLSQRRLPLSLKITAA